MSFLKMSLAYKPSGPIPGYKPMGFYAGWAYMRGNRVHLEKGVWYDRRDCLLRNCLIRNPEYVIVITGNNP